MIVVLLFNYSLYVEYVLPMVVLVMFCNIKLKIMIYIKVIELGFSELIPNGCDSVPHTIAMTKRGLRLANPNKIK